MKLTHDSIERNVGLLIILTVLVVSVGGLLEIVPLFFQKSTTTPVDGLKPYSATRLAGLLIGMATRPVRGAKRRTAPARARRAHPAKKNGEAELPRQLSLAGD